MNTQTGLYGLTEPAPPPRPKSRVWKFVKVILAIAGLFLLSLTMLHKTGGNGDQLKKIIETYLSDSSGYKAQVGTLNAVSFYPLIGIDMHDVTFETKDKVVVGRIDHANFSTSFWSASSGSSIHTIDLSGASAEAGILAPGKIVIKRLFIDPKDKKTPQLSLTGTYDGKLVTMTVDLEVIPGMFSSVYFDFAEPSPFVFNAGDLHAAGKILTTKSGRSLQIDTFSVAQHERPVKAVLGLNAMGRNVGVSGTVESNKTAFDYDVKYSTKSERRVIDGTVTGEWVDINDLVKKGGLFDDYRAFYNLWVAGKRNSEANVLAGTDLDLGIKIKNGLKSGQDLGAIDGKAVIKDGVFDITPSTKATQGFASPINAYFKK